MEVGGKAFPVKGIVFAKTLRPKEDDCMQRSNWKAERKHESAKRRREVTGV